MRGALQPALSDSKKREPPVQNSLESPGLVYIIGHTATLPPLFEFPTFRQALSDSPVGLASWIIEKWYGWSDHDGDLDKVFTKDELLTNIMIYWVTNSGTSSARIYYESRHMLGGLAPTPFPRPKGRVTVPTGCGAFPSQYDRRGTPITTN